MADGMNYKSIAQTKTPYMDLYSAYEKKVRGEGDTYKQGLQEQKRLSEQKVKQEFGQGAEQQYVGYRQQAKQLPEQLAGMGIGGGAAESSLIRLKSAYGQGLGELEREKESTLGGLESTYLQSVADYNTAQRQKLQDAYADYYAKQLAYDEQLRQEELARQEAAREEDMNLFLDTYQATYRSPSQVDSAIAKLSSSDDMNKANKIAYLRAYRNVLSEEAAALASKLYSGGGGGGGGGGDKQKKTYKLPTSGTEKDTPFYIGDKNLQEQTFRLSSTTPAENIGLNPLTGKPMTSDWKYSRKGGTSSRASKAYSRR